MKNQTSKIPGRVSFWTLHLFLKKFFNEYSAPGLWGRWSKRTNLFVKNFFNEYFLPPASNFLVPRGLSCIKIANLFLTKFFNEYSALACEGGGQKEPTYSLKNFLANISACRAG